VLENIKTQKKRRPTGKNYLPKKVAWGNMQKSGETKGISKGGKKRFKVEAIFSGEMTQKQKT